MVESSLLGVTRYKSMTVGGEHKHKRVTYLIEMRFLWVYMKLYRIVASFIFDGLTRISIMIHWSAKHDTIEYIPPPPF